MYKLVLVNIVAVIAVAICYNSEESYFKNILATDLEEFANSLEYSNRKQHSRTGRDIDVINIIGTKRCCNIGLKKYINNHHGNLTRECYQIIYREDVQELTRDAFKRGDLQERRQNMTCFAQCLAEFLNLVDDQGDLLELEFRKFLKNIFKQPWIISQMDIIIPKCLSQARIVKTTVYKRNPDSCNPAAMAGAFCVFNEIQSNCPKDQIENVELCSKFKQRKKRLGEILTKLGNLQEKQVVE